MNCIYENTTIKIWELKLKAFENNNEEFIKEIYRLNDSQKQSTNLKAIMSSWWIWKESKAFNLLLKEIGKVVVNNIFPTFKNYNKNIRLEIIEAWSAIYKKNHFAIPHSHHPNNISFVYYLKSNGLTPLIFDNINFKIYPIKNTLIVFPSNVIHSVPVHKAKEDRICLAGNFCKITDNVSSTFESYQNK